MVRALGCSLQVVFLIRDRNVQESLEFAVAFVCVIATNLVIKELSNAEANGALLILLSFGKCAKRDEIILT